MMRCVGTRTFVEAVRWHLGTSSHIRQASPEPDQPLLAFTPPRMAPNADKVVKKAQEIYNAAAENAQRRARELKYKAYAAQLRDLLKAAPHLAQVCMEHL